MRSSIGRNSGKVCHRGVLANLFVVELVRLGVTGASDAEEAMNLATLHRHRMFALSTSREVVVIYDKIANGKWIECRPVWTLVRKRCRVERVIPHTCNNP